MRTITMPDTPEARAVLAYHVTTCPQFVTFTGRNAEWTDTHIPRTARPVRFIPRAPASSKARTRHPSLSFDSFTIRWT